jgi:threonyl-tRNA synthetase
MSLEFVIIPVTKMFKDLAYELQEMLHDSISQNLCVKVDEEYDSQMYSRIKHWQDIQYDIITIGPNYLENKIISVRFNDKGSKPENMHVDDFIELINSFEIEEERTDKKEEEESGCIIV